MSKIEEWGQKRPVQLAVISLVAGAVLGGLVSAYPADQHGYERGRDAGVIATEEKWNQKVVQTVEERVKEQLPVAYQKEFEFSKAEIAKRDALNSEQKIEIDRLSKQIQDSNRVAAILKMYENFARSAENIRNNLQNARNRNKGMIPRERESAFKLVQDIHFTHDKIEDWANIFNSEATKLASQIEQNRASVTDEQLLAFLSAFAEDSANKRQRALDLLEVASRAQEIRD